MTTAARPMHISVVVPARNEEQNLGRCLRSIDSARQHLQDQHGTQAPDVTVLVVLDSCTDRTAAIALEHRVHTLAVTAGSVGAARDAGVQHALAVAAAPPERHWIANTDGDSAVPSDWLTTHTAHALSGAVVLTGLVRPDPAQLTPGELLRWGALQPVRHQHEQIYGANLGIRADIYRLLGGFPPTRTGEDRALVEAAFALRIPVTATTAAIVVTSSRPDPRAPDGFGSWLNCHIRDRPDLIPDSSTQNGTGDGRVLDPVFRTAGVTGSGSGGLEEASNSISLDRSLQRTADTARPAAPLGTFIGKETAGVLPAKSDLSAAPTCELGEGSAKLWSCRAPEQH